MPSSFVEMFRTATGNDPYPYQTEMARDGLPELVEIPTGLGKTLATVTAWLYRRRFHDDASVRSATARRLVFVLPMRVLVEQTEDVVRGVLKKLGLTVEVHLHVLMGGEPMGGRKGSRDWRDDLDSNPVVYAVAPHHRIPIGIALLRRRRSEPNQFERNFPS
jgi:CRISPR-associated endonuclease/helicase Cas3